MQHFHSCDVLIIGAGIAGLSLAYRLDSHTRVLVVEAESQPAYHASGRSAAMFMETYGTPTIQALTRASRAFLSSSPDGFADHPLLVDRGLLYLVRRHQLALKDKMLEQLRKSGANAEEVSVQQVLERMPYVRTEDLVGAISEPEAMDIDVHELLQGFLRGARRHAHTEFLFDNAVVSADHSSGVWTVRLSNGEQVQTKSVVNAAGAWGQRVADIFGAMDVGLQPKRRSAFTFKAISEETGQELSSETISQWPAIISVDESFYFKPDAGQLLGSPANVDPVEPHDVVAEELDVATGIHRITEAVALQILRPEHTWAGLRSFVPDEEFVVGWDPQRDDFFWLAGQGGYGIQTSPGASLLARNLLLNEPLDPSLIQQGIDPDVVSPARFGTA